MDVISRCAIPDAGMRHPDTGSALTAWSDQTVAGGLRAAEASAGSYRPFRSGMAGRHYSNSAISGIT
jgi:hypothetical protein